MKDWLKKNPFTRFIIYVLLPNKMREWAYKKFLRKNQTPVENKTAEKIAQEV